MKLHGTMGQNGQLRFHKTESAAALEAALGNGLVYTIEAAQTEWVHDKKRHRVVTAEQLAREAAPQAPPPAPPEAAAPEGGEAIFDE